MAALRIEPGPEVRSSGCYSRPLSEPLKPIKAFILDEEPLEPIKCFFGPLSDFIFTFQPLFSEFCPQNVHYLGFAVHFYPEKVFQCSWRAVRGKCNYCQLNAIYDNLSNTPGHRILIGIN